MIQFCKKEAVLSIAVVLALLSVFFVRPDAGYLAYIDFRTLGILFCLMTIVAGLQQIGVFDRMAKGLLAHVAGVCGIVTILVLLCFFLSMLITNDVALITFVPLALIIMKQFSEADRKKWMLKCVVMQTVAANLGSMLTPIGNPQNLYLYGRAGMNISSFFRLMLPYSLISLALLLLWIWLPFLMQRESAEKRQDNTESAEERQDNTESGKVWKPEETSGGWMATDTKALMAWGMLFGISLLAVGRILVWQIPFVLVLLYGLIWKREILRKVDYSLLGTFTALFIFIGNLGRIPAFSSFLQRAMQGREVLTAVFASQVMSNVPAAILLSGFTDQYQALIIGTNLGGLGTLIASMASLISFKYMVREDGTLRGSYLAEFTVANLVFLAVLLGVWWI